MDDITQLLTTEKKAKKFRRNMPAYLRRNGYDVTVRSDFFYKVSNGTYTADMDFSHFFYSYSDKPADSVFEAAISTAADQFAALERMETFTNGQDHLRFRAMPPEAVTADMISEDFPGGIKKVLCYTSDNIHAHILSPEYARKWDMPPEVLFSVADRNMSMLFGKLPSKRFRIGAHECVEFYTDDNDFFPSLMMCGSFYGFVSSMIGQRFLLCIPSEVSFLAISSPMGSELTKIANEVWDENRSSSAPITSAMYLFTTQNVEVIPPPEFMS